MDRKEYETQRQRVEDFEEIWEELAVFDQALAEIDMLENGVEGNFVALHICITSFGLKNSIKKLIEARIAEIKEELEEI